MKSGTPLDYAVFHLSPKHSRCELFVSSDGSTEKIASGLLKPFASHLQIVEEQFASASQSVKLEVGREINVESWFTKGTLERFVRFVSTPEVLELVSTFDVEMSQLEAARKIYSQGAGDQLPGENGSGVTAGDDATKKELLRAIDVRLLAVRQDLSSACGRATSAGFNIDTVSELQMFADRFGAHRLNEACEKFIFVSEKRLEVIQPSKLKPENRALRSSYGSDMSIDDDPTSPPRQVTATGQQSYPAAVTVPLSRTLSRESSDDKEDNKKTNDGLPEKDGRNESSTPDQTMSTQASQLTRRLSVQDRISLFENKQKENSGGKAPAVVAKSELRRLSSDLSASGGPIVDKAVLRRWSGASDMSIDLNADKKDTEVPSSSPTAAAGASQEKKVSTSNEGTTDISSVAKPEIKIIPSLDRVSDGRSKGVSVNHSELRSESIKFDFNMGLGDSDGLKHQGLGKTRPMSFISKAEDQDFSAHNYKTLTGGENEGAVGLGNQMQELSGSQAHTIGVNDCASITQIRLFASKSGEHLEIPNQREEFESRDDSTKQIQKKATQKASIEPGVLENDAGSKIKKAFAARYKGNEGDASAHKEVKSVGVTEVAEKKPSYMPEKGTNTSVSSMEDSGPQRLKSNRHGSIVELSTKARVQRDDSFSGNSRTLYPGKFKRDVQEDIDPFLTLPLDQVQRIRQSKGNQELNDELKMKASELERLFAEHKSRGPTDQSNTSAHKGRLVEREPQLEPPSSLLHTKPMADIAQSSISYQSKVPSDRKGRFVERETQLEPPGSLHYTKPVADIAQSSISYQSKVPSGRKGRSVEKETQLESPGSLHYTKPVTDIVPPQLSGSYHSIEPSTMFSKNSTKLNVESPVKTIDAMDEDFSELSIQEGSRGKLYEMYMQKRSAKLREEWSSNRAEKEARLKSMQDSLERNRSEMKAKMPGPTDRQESVSSVHRRSERLKSYSSKPIMKRDQKDLDFVDSEDDEEALELHENRALNNTLFRDTISRGPHGKKNLPNNRSLSSTTTPRTSAAPIPKSATKNSANSGKRRMQMENPLAQSVPNFSDLRKESTKSSSVATSKITRSQVRSYAPSKSTNEEATIVREDTNKSRRSHSLRKSSANPSDFGEMRDGDNLTPKFDTEVMKNPAAKPFLKKGSRASFVSQTSITRENAFLVSGTRENAFLVSGFIKNEDENEDMESEPDEFASAGKDELEEESEDLNAEEEPEVFNNGEPQLGSENGDMTTFPRMNQALESQIPTIDPMQDWLEESPISWNYTHRQNPYSYPHEMSDVDSPVGSPASWNSNSFNQIETDSARMRKTWGMTQKPTLVAHSSNNLPRKDMKAGFKRLLKFGRKSRGSDILVDWISATTSEGDDDTEDGRDPASRSSEDLRKSRMGFSHGHPSDDGYNENDFFNESVQSSQNSIPTPPASFKLRDDHMSGSSSKAPRSFFSLSTFRSKGSDSKPR